MLWAGEYAEKAAEAQLKSVLRLSRRQIGKDRLSADNELQFGDQIDDELSMLAKRLGQRAPPRRHFRFALDQDLTDQGLEGLCERRIGNVALVLVELPRR